MSGRSAKRLRVLLGSFPVKSMRGRSTLGRLRRAWQSLAGKERGRLAANPHSSEVAGHLLALSPDMGMHAQPRNPNRKRGGVGLLKPFPRVGGPKRNPLHRRGRR